jgi:hypothetical protein
MNLQFWKNNHITVLTDRMRTTLQSQFHVDEQTLNKLRYMGKPGSYAGRRVRHILLFDPGKVAGGEKAIKSYEQIKKDSGSVMFQGHIESGRNDYVYLADARKTNNGGGTQSAAVIASK